MKRSWSNRQTNKEDQYSTGMSQQRLNPVLFYFILSYLIYLFIYFLLYLFFFCSSPSFVIGNFCVINRLGSSAKYSFWIRLVDSMVLDDAGRWSLIKEIIALKLFGLNGGWVHWKESNSRSPSISFIDTQRRNSNGETSFEMRIV